jgi:hypothetical protein
MPPDAIRVAIVAYDGVSLLDLSGPLEALRVASTHPNHVGASLIYACSVLPSSVCRNAPPRYAAHMLTPTPATARTRTVLIAHAGRTVTHARLQNTFATPTATPTDTVTRRANSAVVGATTFNARPLLRGIDAPESTTAPRSDWRLPPER